MAQMGVHPNMTEDQARKEVQRRVQFLCDYAKATGTRGFVLGISGGIDSTLAGRLCQLASEKLNAEGYQAQFMAVRLPYKTQVDEEDAQKALEFISPTVPSPSILRMRSMASTPPTRLPWARPSATSTREILRRVPA